MNPEITIEAGDRPELRLVDRAAASDAPGRVLATILFTDIVGATSHAARLGDQAWIDLLGRHHAAVRRRLAEYRGRELDVAGDGFFAAFDAPGRAIECACAIREDLAELGLQMRAGIHTGECERIDRKLSGIAVHLGARIAGEADVGDILVSGTVKDLVAGSGRTFADRGRRRLKGMPEACRLFAVTPPPAGRRSRGTVTAALLRLCPSL